MQFFPARWIFFVAVVGFLGVALWPTPSARDRGFEAVVDPPSPEAWLPLLDRIGKILPPPGKPDHGWPAGTIYDQDERAWYITPEELADPLPGWSGILVWKERQAVTSPSPGASTATSPIRREDSAPPPIRWLFRGQCPWGPPASTTEWEGWIRETASGRRLVTRQTTPGSPSALFIGDSGSPPPRENKDARLSRTPSPVCPPHPGIFFVVQRPRFGRGGRDSPLVGPQGHPTPDDPGPGRGGQAVWKNIRDPLSFHLTR